MEVNLSVSQCSNFKKAGYFCILNYFRNVADINKVLHIKHFEEFQLVVILSIKSRYSGYCTLTTMD